MKRCTFLSMDGFDMWADDELAREPLLDLGWTIHSASWREPVTPDTTDLVVLRSTWDYHHHPAEFIQVLEGIVAAGIPMQNSLSLVRLNLEKTRSWSNP